MQPLPPHVQAAVDELVALAPPLTEHQKHVIRVNLAPAAPSPGAAQPQAA